MISPFGGSENRSASSAAVPRTTSSKRFVSSRHTATCRSGSAAASDRSKGPAAQLGPDAGERLLAARQEAEELVPPAGEAGCDERRLDRGRPGQHGHRDARIERRPHDSRPRIGDARHAGIGDERDPLPRLEPRQELRRAGRLVVLVVGEEPRLDAVPLEEPARVSCVFAEDDVGSTQLGEQAQRHVVEVPDGSGADRERHYAASSVSNPTNPAPISPATVPSSARTTRTRSRIGRSVSRSITSSARGIT